MGLNVLQDPMHNIMLYSDLFQGQEVVDVRPALPVAVVNVLLGNGLAGARVWAEVPPQLEVDMVLVVRSQPDDSEAEFPEVFTACTVIRTMIHANSDSSICEPGKIKNMVLTSMFSLSDFPLSVSQMDPKEEQKADLSL